jgi:hypothetical protein
VRNKNLWLQSFNERVRNVSIFVIFWVRPTAIYTITGNEERLEFRLVLAHCSSRINFVRTFKALERAISRYHRKAATTCILSVRVRPVQVFYVCTKCAEVFLIF